MHALLEQILDKKIQKDKKKNPTCCPSGSAVKNLPAMQELQERLVQPLGREDPLEKEMATHSSTPSWRISWTEDPVGLQSTGS